MPIIMFDKNEDFVVMTLEEVGLSFRARNQESSASSFCSPTCRSFPCHLVRKL